MSAGAIRAGRAFVELFADRANLSKGLAAAKAQLQGFASSAKSIGSSMLAAAGTSAVPFVAATTVFAGFEHSMARVKALSGASGEDFDRLRQKALDLGAQTEFSASQAAGALQFFALAGFGVKDMLAAVGPALNLASAGQVEIAEAADITAKIMAGMGIAAEDVGGAVDVLTKAMTTANTDILQLGDAMKYVGPIAKSAGLQFEEVVAAVQALSNAGIQADMAGTTLRGAILSLANPTAEAQTELDNLGIAVADAQGDFRPLVDIVRDFQGAIAGMGSAEKLRVLGNIFSQRQATGFAELIAVGGDKLAEFTRRLEDAGGTAEKVANTQMDTLKGDAIIALSALEGLGITVGEAFGEDLRAGTRGITTFINAAGEWVKENREVVQTVAVAVGVVGGLGGALWAVGYVASLSAGALGMVISVLSGVAAFGAPVAAVTTTVLALDHAFGGVELGIGDLVDSALPSLSKAWSKTTASIVGEISALNTRMSGVTTAALEALKAGDVEAAANAMLAGVNAEFTRFVAQGKEVWLDFTSFVEELFAAATDRIAESFVALWARIKTQGRQNANEFGHDVREGAAPAIDKLAQGLAPLFAGGDGDRLGQQRDAIEAAKEDAARLRQIRGETKLSDKAAFQAERDALTKTLKEDQERRRKDREADLERRREAIKAGVVKADASSAVAQQAAGMADAADAAEALATASVTLKELAEQNQDEIDRLLWGIVQAAARKVDFDEGNPADASLALADAQRHFDGAADASLALADAEKEFAKTVAKSPPKGGPGGSPEENGAETVAKQITGTWSGERLGALGASKTAAEKTAKNTEEMVKVQKEVLSETKRNRPEPLPWS